MFLQASQYQYLLAKVNYPAVKLLLSFRRMPESRFYKNFWTPVFTGVTDV
jgi:hypothetical protein